MAIVDTPFVIDLDDDGQFWLLGGGKREAGGSRHGLVVCKQVRNSKFLALPFTWDPKRGFRAGSKSVGRLMSVDPDLPAMIEPIFEELERRRELARGNRHYRPPSQRKVEKVS